jgi:flagellum-specific peptidoglycan hydrolase FlgJ
VTAERFVTAYYPFAKDSEKRTGVPALFALAQSALESGWGKHTPGNMLFGIKAGNGKSFGGWNGEKQLITTTEYGETSTMKFPQILPGYPIKEGNKWKYLVKDYFRAYASPLYTFLDWAGMLSGASRYSKAMQNRKDPYRFAEEVAKAGYATDPNYVQKIKKLMTEIAPLIELQPGNTIWQTVMWILIALGASALIYVTIVAIKKRKILKKGNLPTP